MYHSVLHTLGTSIVPDLIRAFRQNHPHIRFHFTQNYSHSQLKQLLAGELDLCLLASIDTEPPVCWKELWRDELLLWCRSTIPSLTGQALK